MKDDLSAALNRATSLVRGGDPAAATRMIQAALGGSEPGVGAMPPPGVGAAGLGAGLHATMADLAARMPNGAPPEPALPEGARFDAGTFRNAAGARDYRLYVPDLKAGTPSGLIMMLHGCTQTPVDFAIGTGMNRLADAHGLIVIYPAQARGANMQTCWNWFGPADQERGAGEPAILAGLAAEQQRAHDVPRDKVYVAGLSAGGAMAVILGRTYGDVFAAVGAHSALPYKSAHDMPSAFAAMRGTPSTPQPKPVPTIVFHGLSDSTVAPANGQRIADDARPGGVEVMDEGRTGGRRHQRTTILSPEGHAVLEHWRIDGLGHAWSGGDARGSYADPAGPDASAEMVRFFRNTARPSS
jgi:poly(hydroxyalkanoate) depolymerase family esterase